MMLFKLSLLLAVVYFEHGGQAQHAAVVMDAAVMLFVQARLEPFSSKQKNVLQYLGTGLTFLMAFGGVMLSYMRLAQAEASQRLFDKELTDTMAKYEGNMEIIRWILDVVLYVFTIPAIVAFWVKMLQKGKKKIAKRKAKKKAKKMAKLRGENGEDEELELAAVDHQHPNPMYGHGHGGGHAVHVEGAEAKDEVSESHMTASMLRAAAPRSSDCADSSTSQTTKTPGAAGDARMSL